MQLIWDKLEQLRYVKEPLAYHPEGNTMHHIMIVLCKAFYFTQDNDLIMAALLHDICKGDSGFIKDDYWSNPDHPKQSFELIQGNDDIRYLIKSFGANVDTVSNICRYHMACKEEVPRKCKTIPKIETFVILDDMIGRKVMKSVITNIHLPNYKTYNNWSKLGFVGQAPIHRMSNQSIITVTVNRTPYTYPIEALFNHVIKLISL